MNMSKPFQYFIAVLFLFAAFGFYRYMQVMEDNPSCVNDGEHQEMLQKLERIKSDLEKAVK
jgi:hypothetical protein